MKRTIETKTTYSDSVNKQLLENILRSSYGRYEKDGWKIRWNDDRPPDDMHPDSIMCEFWKETNETLTEDLD